MLKITVRRKVSILPISMEKKIQGEKHCNILFVTCQIITTLIKYSRLTKKPYKLLVTNPWVNASWFLVFYVQLLILLNPNSSSSFLKLTCLSLWHWDLSVLCWLLLTKVWRLAVYIPLYTLFAQVQTLTLGSSALSTSYTQCYSLNLTLRLINVEKYDSSL